MAATFPFGALLVSALAVGGLVGLYLYDGGAPAPEPSQDRRRRQAARGAGPSGSEPNAFGGWYNQPTQTPGVRGRFRSTRLPSDALRVTGSAAARYLAQRDAPSVVRKGGGTASVGGWRGGAL